ncbi:MAG: serine hydrolase [Pseudomonadota bacterium]
MMLPVITFLLAAATATDQPSGLYVASYEAYRSPVSGFELKRSDSGWSGLLDGEPMVIQSETEGTIRFELPGGEAFIGTTVDGRLTGFWRRPAHDYAGQAFSTPLRFRQTGQSTWTAKPASLEEDFMIFHYFGEDEGGPFVAIRNPERNAIGASSRYRWAQEEHGSGELFVGEAENRWSRSLSYNSAKDEVVSGWAWSADSSLLRRSTEAEAARFYPRVGSFDGLSRVPELKDGWQVSSLTEAEISAAPLTTLIESIASSDPTAGRPDMIHSLLVAHKGKLVLEEYFHGYDRNDTHDLRSAAKTYAPLLAGALIHDGLELNKDTLVMPILRKRFPDLPQGDARDRITFGNLLSHQSGLACGNGQDGAPPGNEDTLWAQKENFWLFSARLPMVAEPGTRYHYCSGSIHLAAGVLAIMTGRELFELIEEKLMQPLDIPHYHWNVTPNGQAYFGGGAQLLPRDFLKMGQVVLDGGRWRGHQVLDPAWNTTSLEKTVEINPETTETTPEEFAQNYILSADGLGWHLIDIKAGERSYQSYYASGNGGQLVFVLPELELVVGMTGGQYNWGSVWNTWPHRFIGGHIIPAITESN